MASYTTTPPSPPPLCVVAHKQSSPSDALSLNPRQAHHHAHTASASASTHSNSTKPPTCITHHTRSSSAVEVICFLCTRVSYIVYGAPRHSAQCVALSNACVTRRATLIRWWAASVLTMTQSPPSPPSPQREGREARACNLAGLVAAVRLPPKQISPAS